MTRVGKYAPSLRQNGCFWSHSAIHPLIKLWYSSDLEENNSRSGPTKSQNGGGEPTGKYNCKVPIADHEQLFMQGSKIFLPLRKPFVGTPLLLMAGCLMPLRESVQCRMETGLAGLLC